MRAWDHHGSDKPTSPKAILHHTDPKGPNISGGSVADKHYNFLTMMQHFTKESFATKVILLKVRVLGLLSE